MPKILPTPFRIREWTLTLVALSVAVSSLLLSNSAGPGAGGALYLCLIVGTALFVVIGGQDRAFFTGVFASSLSVGLTAWSWTDSVVFRHEPVSGELLWMPVVLFLSWVAIPIVFAQLVTIVICRLERSFKGDKHPG